MSISKNITRKDIAREAGVSVSVVSRALNNSGYVEKEKKNRIIELARNMDYIPNPVAMALQQKKTNQLLFFCGDMTGVYYNQMYHGMAREAEKKGYHILAIMNENDFRLVKRTLADGILFPTETVAQAYAQTVGKNYYLPTVTACFDPSCIFAKPMPAVIIDNYKVVNMAIDYLMKKGHIKIGMAMPFHESYASLRYQYWKERMTLEMGKACMNYLLDIHGDLINNGKTKEKKHDDYSCVSGGFRYMDLFSSGETAAMMYLASEYKATAVLCFNDDLAFGMITRLKKSGVRVPEDVSVMGIDGIFTRERYEPKLTTMAIYPERQGSKCVDVLINMLEGKEYRYMNYSPFEILEGETVLNLS